MTKYKIIYSRLVEPFFNNPSFKIPTPVPIFGSYVLSHFTINWGGVQKFLIKISARDRCF